ncbi:LPS export ABC transporter periplasmic protein LptC [Aliikangiella sp. IMCC44632]
MNNRSKLLLVIILATSLLIISLLPSQPNVKTISKSLPVVEADNYFAGVRIVQFNQNGLLESQLKARQLQYFQAKDTSLLTAPVITLKQFDLAKNEPLNQPVEQSQWKITSQTGQLDHAKQVLVLDSNVEIQQAASEQLGAAAPNELKIYAADLSVFLNQKKARTASSVNLVQSNFMTKAQGLEVDFEQQTFSLNQKVITLGVENEASN